MFFSGDLAPVGRRGDLVVLAVFIIGLLASEVAFAGQRGELSCTSCGYKQQLTIGGTMKSPRLTIYCPQCKTFSYKTFASWKQANEAEEFACPNCSSNTAFAYKGQGGIPCPRCGQRTTMFKTRMMVD
jgi:Zn finger protein HypA/HybF involved in hydrogenase expression